MTRPQRRREFRQIVDGDAVYFPARDRIDELSDAQVLKLLAIALLSYNALSFGLHLLDVLAARGIDCAVLRNLVLNDGAPAA